jgi:hypothetical protein
MQMNGFREVNMRGFKTSIFHVAALLATATAIAGCTDFSTTPESLGRVTVSVTDQNNAGVPLQTVNLLRSDRIQIWRTLRTSSDGTGEFGKEDGGVISQQYIVRILPGGEYDLADGETNDKPVAVVIGQIHPVTFKLKKREVGGLPM